MKQLVRNSISAFAHTRAGKLLAWKLLQANNVERLAVKTDDGTFMVSGRDNMIGLRLFVAGSFDKDLVDLTCEMAAAYAGRQDLTYVDVGANLGSNTVYALRHPSFTRAVCFEPDPANFSNLESTIALSGLGDRVRCEQTAIGAAVGELELELSDVNFGDHRVRMGNSGRHDIAAIPVTTLDLALSSQERVPLGLVSVDVQGYETQVLDGATELLAMDVPFVCELTPDDLSRCGGYDRFFEIAEQSFAWFVDMSRPGSQCPIGELRACAEAVPPGGHADVFLTKRRFATQK
jgi:FkbM family methyltransferase